MLLLVRFLARTVRTYLVIPPTLLQRFSLSPGYLDKDRATGWDIVALADTNWDYANSCGRCVEVRCQPSTFTDGYGESLDRTDGVCRDPDASVIVQVRVRVKREKPCKASSGNRGRCR